MHHIAFLQDLAVVMTVAALATIVFRQCKQPIVLGYILAGFIIGPSTPPFSFINDEKTIETLAELGVIFLMFALGLEFNLGKLKTVGATAFIAAAMEIVLMVWAGYQLGTIFGWNQMDSVFLGAILAISSTTIIVKALQELGKSKERFAALIFGILIVEDILAIVMIALLSGFATTGALVPREVAMTVVKLGAFLGVLLVGGLIIVPRALGYVGKFKSNEVLLITVVGLCFGVSLLTVKLGYSVALGAFLIGAIISEAREITRIEALMHPIRDLFSAVFFVSIGLLIDPALLLSHWVPVLIISVVVIVGKVISCGLGTFVAGNDMRSSLRVGMGLSQIGEFSFIIAGLGLSLNVTSDFIYPIAVAVSAITTLTTPYLIRSSDHVVSWFDRVAPQPLLRWLDAYSQWMGNLYHQRGRAVGFRLLRRIGWQVGLNLLLITAVFIAANFLLPSALTWWPNFPGGLEGIKAMLWLGAMLVSLPLLIASWRKFFAVGMIVAEMSVSRSAAGVKTEAMRTVVGNTVTVAASGALLMLLLMLSATILPSWNMLILAVLIVGVASVVLYRASVKLYARAQYSLQETFAEKPLHDSLHEPQLLPPMLREAKLHTFTIEEGAPAVGKMLLELKLRTNTGASVVGIQRRGESIVNPGAEEELETGDQVLLIGNLDQLEAAKGFFARQSAKA